MEIKRQYDLTILNTFGVPSRAKFFAVVKSERDFQELWGTREFKENPKLILGGGSNILLTGDFAGLVILNQIKGMEILEEGEADVRIRAMSGEVWHDLVLFAVARGYWGIENLSLIPGSVGAAPMQNIGAYGAELKDTLESVEAFNLSSGKKVVFKCEDCAFGYRDSVFKNIFKSKYFITAVTIRLSKTEKKNISYKILKEYLAENKIEVKNSKDVSDAVTAIRKSKLPDPKIIGNAGSFFKNIFVTKKKIEELQKKYPDIVHFLEGDKIKISSAWLIERAEFKGYREGDAGVHERQALVLVNHGNATGQDIRDLADKIIRSVEKKFGLTLVPEVNFVP